MREHEEILLGGMFRPSEQNCPTREGELIESLDKIYDIPNPRVGMRVYVENTGKEYIVKSLKEKTIGGVTVPNAVVKTFEETVSGEVLGNVASGFANQFSEFANQFSNIERNIKANAAHYNKIGFSVYEDKVQLYAKNISDNNVRVDDIPAATSKRAGVMSAEDKRKLDAAGSGATKIVWDSSSNMNDFKTPGVYDIYGERTRQDDNLPILNASPGHSIAARLTVVASTLQPANNEICITQFLQLSNRIGREGTTYVRTYNENNNSMNGWSAWQKQMGMVETVINTNTNSFNSEIFAGYAASVGEGLNGMIDNGIYSGIYTDGINYSGEWDDNLGKPLYVIDPAGINYLETFVLIVINDYVASGQAGLPRHITQLKYAVDAITGQSTVKKRVGTGDDRISWGDWEDIGGSGSNEVDVTDKLLSDGLLYLAYQTAMKENVVYKAVYAADSVPELDVGNKIKSHINSKKTRDNDKVYLYIKIENRNFIIDCNIHTTNGILSYRYTIKDFDSAGERVCVSADMTTL